MIGLNIIYSTNYPMSDQTFKRVPQLVAIVFSSAIVGAIFWGGVGSAQGCVRYKSSSQSDLVSRLTKASLWMGEKGSDFLASQGRNLAFYGFLGLLGVGTFYKSYQAGLEAQAAFSAMTDDFDVEHFEDDPEGFYQDFAEVTGERNSLISDRSNLDPDGESTLSTLNNLPQKSDKKVVFSK